MNQAFYRELLQTKPKLLAEIIRFNREPAPVVTGPLAEAISRHPSLFAAAAARIGTHEARRSEPCWQFAQPSERLVLLPPDVLERLGRMAAGALYGDRMAHLLVQADVQDLKAFLGEDIYRWSLVRGRFLVGSLAELIRTAEPDMPLPAIVRRASMGLFLGFADGWDEPLRTRARTLFGSLTLPPSEAMALEPEVRRRLWHFFNKLILRELDSEWTPFFD